MGPGCLALDVQNEFAARYLITQLPARQSNSADPQGNRTRYPLASTSVTENTTKATSKRNAYQSLKSDLKTGFSSKKYLPCSLHVEAPVQDLVPKPRDKSIEAASPDSQKVTLGKWLLRHGSDCSQYLANVQPSNPVANNHNFPPNSGFAGKVHSGRYLSNQAGTRGEHSQSKQPMERGDSIDESCYCSA